MDVPLIGGVNQERSLRLNLFMRRDHQDIPRLYIIGIYIYLFIYLSLYQI